MLEADFPTLLNFFKVIANESRLKMLGILAQQECSVEELATLVQLKEPTVSHHLTKLKELNLVKMHPEGNTHLYKLNQEALQELNQSMLTPNRISTLVNGVNGEAWEDKVLRSFLEGNRLKEIPASRKKRIVILKWLARQFEPEVTYSERTVNEILQRFHPDCATLRRELVGYQMMQRENGIYRKLPQTAWNVN